jgi:2-polyprenyl-6-hydroxyphenyl methylase/3-demethylubiquinone-9 3-methyltransferase
MLSGHSIFVFFRNLIFPYKAVEKYFPARGSVLDVGCGHGTLAYYLAITQKDRKVLGIDPSPVKIREAKKSHVGLKNLCFKRTYLKSIKGKWQTISLISVLYLLPGKDKSLILKLCKAKLKKGGTLIINETERSWFLGLEEFLMTKFFKLTYTDYKNIEITSKKQIVEILKKIGFKQIQTHSLKGVLPYKHVLYVAQI